MHSALDLALVLGWESSCPGGCLCTALTLAAGMELGVASLSLSACPALTEVEKRKSPLGLPFTAAP
jgi:hypothetical protein